MKTFAIFLLSKETLRIRTCSILESFFRKLLSKATFERKLSSVSLPLGVKNTNYNHFMQNYSKSIENYGVKHKTLVGFRGLCPLISHRGLCPWTPAGGFALRLPLQTRTATLAMCELLKIL